MSSAVHLNWPRKLNHVPKEVFIREDIFEAEMKRFFRGPEWNGIGHVAEIPNPGDFKTIALAGVPLLIVRGKDNVVRVFYNTCIHRATQLETARRGNATRFQCPYHRWTYMADGQLIGCPGHEDFPQGFDVKEQRLAQPRYEIFSGVIFVTLSPDSDSLEDYLGIAKDYLRASLGGDRSDDLVLLGYQNIRLQCNWKAMPDNDGYHVAQLHTAFRMLGWQGGKGNTYTERNRGHRIAEGVVNVAINDGVLQDESLVQMANVQDGRDMLAVTTYPNLLSVRHFGTPSIRVFNPVSVSETDTQYIYFAYKDDTEEMRQHRVRQISNLLGPSGVVSLEDAAMFNRIQTGSHTPGTAVFQKGVRSSDVLPTEFHQNEETANLVNWEYYRKAMGFERNAE